jgi:hypothetical protein
MGQAGPQRAVHIGLLAGVRVYVGVSMQSAQKNELGSNCEALLILNRCLNHLGVGESQKVWRQEEGQYQEIHSRKLHGLPCVQAEILEKTSIWGWGT